MASVGARRGAGCRHYIAVLWCEDSRQWLLFDDRRVRPLGAEWPAVRRHLLLGRLQPLLLLYALGPAPEEAPAPARGRLPFCGPADPSQTYRQVYNRHRRHFRSIVF